MHTARTKIISVIGSGSPTDAPTEQMCLELGRRAVDAGFRVVTGGLGGVMEAVSRGAHQATSYQDGDVVGVLPGPDATAANPSVDIAIPTGIGIARNLIVVAMADVVVAVRGGSGTLSEMALAWQLGKPIIAMAQSGGWAAKMAGQSIDDRHGGHVQTAQTAEQAIALAVATVGEITS